MKLKTERRESTDSSFVLDGWKDQFMHDAAVAHALMQAIKVRMFHAGSDELDAFNGILDRAAEILAGWGIEDDESN